MKKILSFLSIACFIFTVLTLIDYFRASTKLFSIGMPQEIIDHPSQLLPAAFLSFVALVVLNTIKAIIKDTE
jgi:hypothetical protein